MGKLFFIEVTFARANEEGDANKSKKITTYFIFKGMKKSWSNFFLTAGRNSICEEICDPKDTDLKLKTYNSINYWMVL